MSLTACSLATLLLLSTTGRASEESPADAGDQIAWRYVDRDLTVVIKRVADGAWVAERSDGKRPAYREVERKGDEITLQNTETKLFVRLTPDRAYWRRPADDDWTPWVKGGWVVDTVAIPAKRSPDPAPSTTRRIKLAYFVPSNRKPTANCERKIRVVMAVVNDLYKSDLTAKGYKTDGLHFDGDKEPAVVLVRGARDARHYNAAPAYDADEQWRRLQPEIRAKVGNPQKQVIVVFAETYDDGPAELLWPGVIARGAYMSADGGLAVFSAHLLRDQFMAATPAEERELFFDQTPVPGRKAWGHKMNSPRGAFAEAGIGAVAHELGHALGLPHDRRDDARDIMGNGFRNIRLNSGKGAADRKARFSDDNARLLMSSRYLTADLDTIDEQPPKLDAKLLPAGNAVSVKASDDRGLRAFVLIDRTKGSVVAGRALKGKSVEFRESFTLTKKAAAPHLQFIVTDTGGHQTRFSIGGPARKKGESDE